jgi:hypothetical protein
MEDPYSGVKFHHNTSPVDANQAVFHGGTAVAGNHFLTERIARLYEIELEINKNANMKYEVINLLHCLNIVRKTFMLFQNLKYYVTKNIKQVKPLLLLVLNQTLQKINLSY